MSPTSFKRVLHPNKPPVDADKGENSSEPAPETPQPTAVKEEVRNTAPTTTVMLSGIDSYVRERMVEQPTTLDDVIARYETVSVSGSHRHRMVLPEFFEGQSYDCTWRDDCQIHKADGSNRGPFIFRWLFKEKRSLDRAMNVSGWTLVNRSYFPSAPRSLFTANGAVEMGDAILGFIPVKKAMEMRHAPGKKSDEALKNRMTDVADDYVMMTGDPSDKNYYKPNLPPETVEREGGGPGVMVEGTEDF